MSINVAKVSGQAELSETSPMRDLVAAIRRYEKIIREYARSALRTALDLGDALALARARVNSRQWKKWRAANCPEISKRRDEVCRQLAANRARVETELEKNPDLSIREALKLITIPKPPRP